MTTVVLTTIYGVVVMALTNAGILLSLVVGGVVAILEQSAERADTTSWSRAEYYLFSFAAVVLAIAIWVALP